MSEPKKNEAGGAGPAQWDVFGVEVTVLAGAKETAGGCSVAKIVCRPGTGAPLHRHAETERFHVTRGRLAVSIEDQVRVLASGDSVVIEPWVTHAFANDECEEVEFIAIGTPAGHEEFFRQADELARRGHFNPRTAEELCRRHRIELVAG